MDIAKLFKGVAVIIDDKINDETEIKNILGQIKKMNIPYLAYDSIPPDEIVSNFQNLSFLLLDWKLITDVTDGDLLDGVRIPDTLANYNAETNIRFLKMLINTCFCPVFIFSNED